MSFACSVDELTRVEIKAVFMDTLTMAKSPQLADIMALDAKLWWAPNDWTPRTIDPTVTQVQRVYALPPLLWKLLTVGAALTTASVALLTWRTIG